MNFQDKTLNVKELNSVYVHSVYHNFSIKNGVGGYLAIVGSVCGQPNITDNAIKLIKLSILIQHYNI